MGAEQFAVMKAGGESLLLNSLLLPDNFFVLRVVKTASVYRLVRHHLHIRVKEIFLNEAVKSYMNRYRRLVLISLLKAYLA